MARLATKEEDRTILCSKCSVQEDCGILLVPGQHHDPCYDLGKWGRSRARLMKTEPRGHCPPLQRVQRSTL